MKLIDKMEEDEDVSAVYHNLEITEELMQSLSISWLGDWTIKI